MKIIEITLDDPRKIENEMFSNLVDPLKLSLLIDRIMNTDEKRSLNELVEALLQGK